MAGENPLLDKLRATAALLDDDALSGLANKGLVRRARKDLETTTPTLVGSHEGRLRFSVADALVELTEPPAQSRCTCPAGGICRHILIALLHLRESAPTVTDTTQSVTSAADEALAVDDATLEKWAGKPLIRRATQALLSDLAAEFDEAGALVVRLPGWNVVCRWLPGAGLAGMVCSCHAAGPCAHRVAAVMAFQLARGKRTLEGANVAREAAEGTPRTREEVLASVGAVLRETVALGLSRISQATADRLRTLAVSAHGVDLPRLERLLQTLSTEVHEIRTRSAQAATPRLLATAARTEALRRALERPTSALVGQHRSHYEKVGDLDLIGLGARRWHTRSGYHGLTVYFWDRSAKNWATWNEARPAEQAGFVPAARYQQDGPWSGCPAPAVASRSQVRLIGAWRNRVGRLSGRSATRSIVSAATEPRAVAEAAGAVARWNELAARAQRLFASGLRERSEQDEVVFLLPRSWGPAVFDSIRQELIRPVFDESGRSLSLVLPHTPQTENAVTRLEQYDTSQTYGLLGLLRLLGERLTVEPIALYDAKGILNLTLDGARKETIATSSSRQEIEEGEPEEEAEEPTVSTSALGLLLARIAEELEALSEGGLRAARDLSALRRLATQADTLGLAALHKPISRLIEQLEKMRKSVDPAPDAAAESLLQTYYLVRLAAAQETVLAASASLEIKVK